MWLTGADGLSIGRDGHSFLLTAGDNPLLVEDFSLDWWWFPLLAAAAVLLGLIIGAVILRFGRRGGWTIWCIWMLCCFVPQLGGATLLSDWLEYLAVLAVLFVAGLFVWSVWYLLRAPIKN